MAQPRGSLIAFRNDRLGARLISLVNTLRLSAVYQLPFKVHWPEAADIGQVFNDPTELFDATFVERYFIDRPEWLKRRPASSRIGNVGRDGAEGLAGMIDSGTDVTVDQAFGIQVLHGEDPDRVKADLVRVVAELPWAEPLKAPVAKVQTALAGATAYHIRRGDLTDELKAMNKPWPHKMVPNEFYEAHMERALGEGGAVIFSDNSETLGHYQTRFPRLKTIHQIVDTSQLTEAQGDLLELYAMSRCAKIIAPERSAFSSTAQDLGSAVKLDVTDDLTPDMLRASQEALVTRLRDAPESFTGDGDIGQCLAHAAQYLEQNERWAEAAALLSGHVARGLNIAFVYPDAMRLQHRAGDVAGVLATGEAMLSRPLVNARYFVDAEIQHGYGHIRAGQVDRGLRHVANAFWHGPSAGVARLLVPALVEVGLLTPGNFLPVSRLQLNLRRRRGPLRQLVTEFPEIMRLPDVDLPKSVGDLDAAIWDWELLLRGASLKSAIQKGEISRSRQQLLDAEINSDDAPEQASLLAVFDAFEGKDGGIERLEDLAGETPDHVMTWQRLGHARFLARDFQGAAEALDRAADLAPDVPAVLALAGLMQLRMRRNGLALKALSAAYQDDIGLPCIPGLLAQALEADDQTEAALQTVERAEYLAPMEPDFALQRARLLETLGRHEEAIVALQRMVDCLRATARVFAALVRLQVLAGDADGAQETIRIAQERFPSHPSMQQLSIENAA